MSNEHIVVAGSRFNSILTAFVAILAIGLIVVAYFTWKSLRDENQLLRNEIVEAKNLTETLIRGSTKWATKDDVISLLSGLVTKDDMKAIQNDLNSLGSRLSAVGQTIGTIKEKIAKLESSDREGPENPVVTCSDGKIIDVYGYTKKPQIKELEDSNKAPLASVQFDASKDKPWSYKSYKRDYELITAAGQKDSGELIFYHSLSYSIPDKSKDKYKIQLVTSSYLQVPSYNKMFWFNPRIDGSVFVGGKIWGFSNDYLLSAGFDFGISISSFGPNIKDNILKLFRVGIGYDISQISARFSFSPILLNFGRYLPMLTNLYIMPQIGIDTRGNLTINGGIGAQF